MTRFISVHSTNDSAMSCLASLYFPKGSVVRDVTFGKGVFWKLIDTRQFDFLGSDINGDIRYDFNDLPFEDNSVDVVVFDPPYRYSPTKGITRAGFEDRYKIKSTAPKNVQGVVKMYKDFIDRSSYLKVGGIMIIKCQDTVQDGNQHWVHMEIADHLARSAFILEDIAIVVTSTKNVRWKQQYHLDKAHSYFLVAKKVKE